MAERKRSTPNDRSRARGVGRELADRINEYRARQGLGPDPRLEVALTKTRGEMTPAERAADRELRAETTRMLEERIADHQARVSRRGR